MIGELRRYWYFSNFWKYDWNINKNLSIWGCKKSVYKSLLEIFKGILVVNYGTSALMTSFLPLLTMRYVFVTEKCMIYILLLTALLTANSSGWEVNSKPRLGGGWGPSQSMIFYILAMSQSGDFGNHIKRTVDHISNEFSALAVASGKLGGQKTVETQHLGGHFVRKTIVAFKCKYLGFLDPRVIGLLVVDNRAPSVFATKTFRIEARFSNLSTKWPSRGSQLESHEIYFSVWLSPWNFLVFYLQ